MNSLTKSQINKIHQLMIVPGAQFGYSKFFANDLLRLFLSDNKIYDFRELRLVIELVSHGKKLPKKCDQHQLKYRPDHIMDVHIENDWVLLYKISDRQSNLIILYRTGTRKQLFKR